MKRAVLLLLAVAALSACLEPGSPYLAVKDSRPPVVVSTSPAFAGGVAQTIGRDAQLEIVFSEPMEARSLRPGINVLRGPDSVALIVASDPIDPNSNAQFRVVVRPDAVPLADGGVDPAGGKWAANSSFTLILRTLLTDTEGNPLEQEVRVPFRTGP